MKANPTREIQVMYITNEGELFIQFDLRIRSLLLRHLHTNAPYCVTGVDGSTISGTIERLTGTGIVLRDWCITRGGQPDGSV